MLYHLIKHTLAVVVAGSVLIGAGALQASEADEGIAAAFTQSYAFRTFLKDDAIKAECKNGVLTLCGEVAEASHNCLAQEAAAGIPGILRVENRLKVDLEGNEESDSWVRAKVRSVLALHRTVSACTPQVEIQNGVVTLRGVATSEAQRELAAEYAGDVKGVLRVSNVMTVVNPPAQAAEPSAQAIDDASITAQVKVALLSHRSTSSVTTKVGTTDGVVTVTGIAKNVAEKTLVTRLAADISGVRSVVNNMILAAKLSEDGLKPAGVRNLRLVTSTR